MLVGGEERFDPLALSVGEQVGSGVQGATGAVERVAGAAPVTAGVLLDAASAPVQGVAGQAQAAMAAAAVAELLEADPENPGKRRIRPELWPDPGFVDVGVRGDASELAAQRALEPADHTGEWTDIKFVDAVAKVIDRRMETDPRIVVMGEDVHRLNGGTNGATKGLAKKYGSDALGDGRVLGTPISENAFTGLAAGLALDGRFRPVVEFMYPDFMWVAADQVFSQIGKARHLFGGDNPVPLVLRTKVAMGSGYGSQHLMDTAGIFATAPGWRIVAPSTTSSRPARSRSDARDPTSPSSPTSRWSATRSRRSSRRASTRSSSTCAGSTAHPSTGRRSRRASRRPTPC